MPHLIDEARPVVTQTDWHRVRRLTDEEIARAVAVDPDAAPIPTTEQLKLFQPAPARRKG